MANRIVQVHKLGKYNRKQPDMDTRGKQGYELAWSIWVHFTVFDRRRMEIILASFFAIISRGIGQGLSDAIRSSFKIFVVVN